MPEITGADLNERHVRALGEDPGLEENEVPVASEHLEGQPAQAHRSPLDSPPPEQQRSSERDGSEKGGEEDFEHAECFWRLLPTRSAAQARRSV